MKLTLLFLLVCFIYLLPCTAQIISEEGKAIKENKKKSPTYAFLEFNRTNSYRTLAENKLFISYPLGERVNEKPLNVWSYFLGMNTGLSRFLRFEGGISYMQTGEQYNFEGTAESDSTFSYQTKYRYFAMPCQLKFESGKNWRISLGAGLLPQLYNAYRQEQQWTTELGGKKENTIKSNNTCNSFALSLISSLGLHYFSDRNWGIFLKMTYRQQVTNTFTKYGDYEHQARGLGYSLGISKNIE